MHISPGIEKGKSFQWYVHEEVLLAVGWTHFKHVNNPWKTTHGTSDFRDCGVFPLFKFWVMVFFADSSVYIQKNSVWLGPIPNHRPPLHSCPLYCVLCGICRGGQDSLEKKKILYLLIIIINLSSWEVYL